MVTESQSSGSGFIPGSQWGVTSCRRSLVILIVVFFFCLSAPNARSQDNYLDAIGIPPFTTAMPVDYGFTNLTNGALHLEIPIASFPQRDGKPFKISLVFDVGSGVGASPGNVMAHEGPGAYPYFSLGGWRIVKSSSPGNVQADDTPGSVCGGDGNDRWETYDHFTLEMPDGTSHTFDGIKTKQGFPTECNDGSQYNIPSGSARADDSSGYYMVVTNFEDAVVYAPDGTEVYPVVKDSNGNFYSSITNVQRYNNNGYYYPVSYHDPVDSLGRPLETTTVNGNSIYLDVLNSQGSTSRYTATIGLVQVYCPLNCLLHNSSFPAITSLALPDGTAYSFTYDSGTYGTGYLTSMTLPTGDTVNYTFGIIATGGRWLTSISTSDGTWNISPSWDSTTCQGHLTYIVNCQQYVTVTKPFGESASYTFNSNNGMWLTNAQFYDASSSLQATLSQEWDFTHKCLGYCNILNGSWHITKLSKTITLPMPNGPSVNQTTQYTWDSAGPTWAGSYGSSIYGQLVEKREWKFYTGSLPSSPDRTTTTDYLNGSAYLLANIVDRPTVVTVTDGNGTVSQTNYFYDEPGTLTAANATGLANHDDTNFSITNTVRGNVTRIQNLVSGTSDYLTTSKTYDITGHVRSSTDAKGNPPTTYSYDDNFYTDGGDGSNPTSYSPTTPTGAYLKTITHPTVGGVALVETFGSYWGTGQKALSTDANNQTTYYHYHDSLNRATSIKFPNMGWKKWAYPTASKTPVDTGLGIAITTPTITCSGTTGCRNDETQLDTRGRVIHQLLVSDPDGETIVDTTYDADGRVHSVSNPHRGGTLPTDGIEVYGYDGLDRKTQITRADGSVSYNYYGATVGTHGGRSSQFCSGVGYPVLKVDEAGHMRQYWYDGFGRLIEVDEPDPTNGSLVSGAPAGTCYSYNGNNNLTAVTQGSQTRSYSYDMISRLTMATDPESGIVYSYYKDAGGYLCSGDPASVCRRTDARGITTTYYYDAVNRLIQKTYTDSTPQVKYGYDAVAPSGCTPPSLTIVNGKGRRTSMCDGSGATAWSYDEVGDIRYEARTIGSATKTIQYTYNLDNTVASIQYPSGNTITYKPGDAQRPLWAKDLTDNIDYVKGVSSPNYYVKYAPQGAPESLQDGSNLVTTSFYNQRLQPCRISVTTGTNLPANCGDVGTNTGNTLDFTYDFSQAASDNGNVTAITNNRDTTRSEAFTYDYLNRLATAAASTYATSPANCWSESYSAGLDRWGNISSIGAISSDYNGCTNTENLSITISSSTNRITTAGYCYDAAGNMLGMSSCSEYTYDAENRMTSAAGITYTYDGDGKRVKKSSGVLYWYDIGNNPLAETDTSGNTINEYVFFQGRRIARRDSSGNVDYYISDHLGTARVVTNSTGTILDDCDLYPYGGERCVSTSSGNHYIFTGKERDSESGLDYFIARHYAGSLGRFMSPDQFPGGIVDAFTGVSVAPPGPVPYADISDPQTLNKYGYVRDNPLRYIDPDGHHNQCNHEANGDCTKHTKNVAQKQNTQEHQQYQQELKQHDQQMAEKMNPTATDADRMKAASDGAKMADGPVKLIAVAGAVEIPAVLATPVVVATVATIGGTVGQAGLTASQTVGAAAETYIPGGVATLSQVRAFVGGLTGSNPQGGAPSVGGMIGSMMRNEYLNVIKPNFIDR